MTDRYQAVAAVLVKVLFLNLAVAATKLVLGYATGAVSVVSDGLHSLTDSFSNVAALLGVRVARKPPDVDHPYGHRKFESIAAAAIAAFLLVVMIEVGRAAWQRFFARWRTRSQRPDVRRHGRDDGGEPRRRDLRAPCRRDAWRAKC